MTLSPKARAGQTDRRYLRAAIVSTALIVAATYVAFAGGLPFGGEFEVRGTFSNANQLKPGSPVRLNGVQIGEVTDIGPGRNRGSTVTMRIDEPEGLHADARLSVEPRLLFEGNFYVSVSPGTPGAPPLDSGATIPRRRTDAPVQIDQVLSALTAPAREAIRSSFAELAAGLGEQAGGGAGYQGLRSASRELDGALADLRTATRAARGTEAGDARRALGGARDFSSELSRDPQALAGVVANFNRVAAALSADSDALSSTVRRLDEVLRIAPRNLTALDNALPTLTRFADELRPALHVAPTALGEAKRLLRQVTRATRPPELPALLRATEALLANLPDLESRLDEALSLVTPAARCVSENVLPVLNTEVPDGATSSGRPAWQDLLHMGANLTQTSPGFDGNGGTLRISIAESENALTGVIPGIGTLVGAGALQGVRPVWLGAGVEPEFRPDQWCADQALPDLDARSREGLIQGLTSAPLPEPEPQQQRRTARMAELLGGSKSDRRELLELLLRGLPGASDAGAEAAPGGASGAPDRDRSSSDPQPSPGSAPEPDPPTESAPPAGGPRTPQSPAPSESAGSDGGGRIGGLSPLLEKLLGVTRR